MGKALSADATGKVAGAAQVGAVARPQSASTAMTRQQNWLRLRLIIEIMILQPRLVEITISPDLAALAEIGGQRIEVDGVNRAVDVGIAVADVFDGDVLRGCIVFPAQCRLVGNRR